MGVQAHNLDHYLRSMPMITDVDKWEEVNRRVRASLRRKTQEAREMRRW